VVSESQLVRLSPADEAAVHAAIAALEIAEGVVPAEAFTALQDPALRRAVTDRLAGCGRTLIPIEARGTRGYVSGYDDQTADELVDDGVGVLSPLDRAVLTLVLLRTVAIPRANGRRESVGWLVDDGGVGIDDLAQNRHLTKTQITSSIRRLRSLGLIRPGHRSRILPGPAFLRLTEHRSTQLWEDMVLLCRPDGLLAQALLRRRAERRDGQPIESGAISTRYRTPDLSYPEADLAKGML
jgi:hypothetical protein